MTHPAFFFPLLFISLFSGSFLHANSPGSVWVSRGATGSMYSDGKAAGVGDVVTVVIEESASVSTTRNASSDQNSSVNDQLGRILFSNEAWGPRGGPFSRNGEMPAMSWQTGRQFEGGGSITGNQTMSSRLSAVVIDRLPNGNLIIEGVRRITYNEETNYLVLRGVIRPVDIAPNNTINSSRLADAEIEIVGEGSLTQAQREGWLRRFYNWINPF